ncbi:hypothetical protein LTR78_000328 [Recurvomyces mirabilis]|uniref:Uncharacterized protein n=1 Tax=Recurvomyces mirabilis TaxID=574656 RepID=A0AAE0WXX0_9PEZI|nr:hypothetical protein LTR78_000328 [Recurvomyces mirabilis]KAK5161983.1 hypothetical protein LTS14_000329 [Recurvomyces mirabilis]
MATFRLTRRQKRLLQRGSLAILALIAIITIWNRLRSSGRSDLSRFKVSNVREILPPRKRDGCLATYEEENIVIIVKTSASGDPGRLQVQLQSSLRCVKDLLIVSDLDAVVDGYQIHDVLQSVDPAIRDHDPDFDLYHAQLTLSAQGFTPERLGDIFRGSPKVAVLEKYIALQMLRRAYEEMPGRAWYVFLQSDTYLNWANLVTWLERMEASQGLFIGAPNVKAGIRYNDLSSGFVLSASALHALATQPAEFFAAWEKRTAREGSGDMVLSLALADVGLNVSGVWPMLGGDSLYETAYGRAGAWCQPIITLRGIDGEQMSELWGLEREVEQAGRKARLG